MIHDENTCWDGGLCAYDEDLQRLKDELARTRQAYDELLEDVRNACGCTDGDDIRAQLEEWL